jgi:RsiW-degrading membrane proteinase PrsW (M82 family)
MGSSSVVTVAGNTPITRERMERMFYLISGVLMLGIIVLGFRHFYLQGRDSTGDQSHSKLSLLYFFTGS